MATRIRDISDKGRKEGRSFRYEVGVLHTGTVDEAPEIYAKFRSHGDATVYAERISQGSCQWEEVIIRS